MNFSTINYWLKWLLVSFILAGCVYGTYKDYLSRQRVINPPPNPKSGMIHQQCNQRWVYKPVDYHCPKPKEVM